MYAERVHIISIATVFIVLYKSFFLFFFLTVFFKPYCEMLQGQRGDAGERGVDVSKPFTVIINLMFICCWTVKLKYIVYS